MTFSRGKDFWKKLMKKLLLLDADVVIDLHSLDLFDILAKAYNVMVTQEVFREAKWYPKRGKKIAIDIEDKVSIITDISIDRVHEVYSEAREARLTIDDGEATSIAYIIQKKEDLRFCTCDKAAIILLSYMGLEKDAVSLETALRESSHHKKLFPRHLKSEFQDCVKEGKVRLVQYKKFD
jgi:predicted nucleic acid-binding protein